MGRYFIKRVLGTIPLMLVISFIIFMFVHMIPGDPARLMAGKDATMEEINRTRQSLGLDQPLMNQYFMYLNRMFHGDLGTSSTTGQSVTEMIGPRFKPTFTLAGCALVWSLIIGVLLGVFSAVKRGKWEDYIGMLIAISGISIPVFWLGLVLIQIFSVQLGWLPTGGLDNIQSYILPSFSLGVGVMAIMARFSRSSMLENMKEDYVRTARAKGQKESMVVMKHAFRNSLIEVVTVAGLQIGGLLAGSILVETVFTIPGMGRLLVDSIQFRDYPVIEAELLLFSLQFVVINLIVDLLYGVLNPKIRYES